MPHACLRPPPHSISPSQARTTRSGHTLTAAAAPWPWTTHSGRGRAMPPSPPPSPPPPGGPERLYPWWRLRHLGWHQPHPPMCFLAAGRVRSSPGEGRVRRGRVFSPVGGSLLLSPAAAGERNGLWRASWKSTSAKRWVWAAGEECVDRCVDASVSPRTEPLSYR